MVEEKKLEEYKNTIQNIIDKYFPENLRFSVKDYTQEQIRYVSRLLLEKDEKKRRIILNEINEKIKSMEYEYEKVFSEVENYKRKYDNQMEIFDNLEKLIDDIELERTINS